MSVSEREAGLKASYRAHPSQIPIIRQDVARVATTLGARYDALVQINLAVTEAVTNAVVHAYRDRREVDAGAVRVIVQRAEPDLLDIRVLDDGVGLSPRVDSPGLGVGIGLMTHESDSFEIRAVPDVGTEIVLRFRLDGPKR